MHCRRLLLVGAALLLGATGHIDAQNITAFKTGERTTGLTKQCYYEALGNQYTRTLRSIDICPLSVQVQAAPKPKPEPEKRTVTAYKTGERTTGMTKQCYYNALGNEYTRTIQAIELCPLSIRVTL